VRHHRQEAGHLTYEHGLPMRGLERYIMSKSLWSSETFLGIPSMDGSHKALLDKLALEQNIPDADFPGHYAALVARVENEFREEEQLMEQIDFPGICAHREQHAKLLGGLHHAAAAVMEGDIALGCHTIELLPEWFVFHISTMDTALAFALQFRNEEQQDTPPDTKST
jgi:hemerythrin